MLSHARVVKLLTALCALGVVHSTPARAQSASQNVGQVAGTVADSAGAPMVGVRVTVAGVSLASSTNQAGRYTLVGVPVGAQTIRARALGYQLAEQTVTISAGRPASASFRLARSSVALERVVVNTGYGQQLQATTTGAANVVEGGDIGKRTVSNINKGLQGLMPGVTVQDFGGRPGDDRAQIRIRGVGTLGNSGALVLVDGVPGDIGNLDPNEVESVTVLKDAASAAIYGARAANGVVLVKTRRGGRTGALKVSYDGFVATQKAQDTPQRVDVGTELRAINQIYTYNGLPAKYSQGLIDSTVAGLNPDKYPNTDWLALILRSAPMTDQTVRVAGGSDLASVSVSANKFDQTGIMSAEMFYKRFTVRANSDYTITKRLTANADVVLMDERVVRPLGEGGALFDAFHDTPRIQAAIYSDGTYGLTSGKNPLATLKELGYVNGRWRSGQINTAAQYALENGLKFRAQYTGSNKDFRGLQFTPRFAFADRSTPTNFRIQSVRTSSADSRSTDFTTDVQATGEYEHVFARNAVHLLLGAERRQFDNDNAFAQRQGAYSNDLQLPGSGDATFQTVFGDASTNRLVRSFGRLNYGFDNKYLIEANFSRDGSSRFGESKKYGVFPSISAAWRVSDEPYFKNTVGFVNDLKLRGSWGRVGNDQIGDYLYQQTINLNSGNYSFGNTLSTGATPGRIANPDIGWESTEQTNVGVDVEVFSGRLNFTGDVYKKNTSGILLAVPISTLVGQGAPTQNAAAIQNAGWEGAVNWRDAIGGVSYTIGFNISDNKNKITDLPGGDQINPGGLEPFPSIRRVGEAIASIYGVEAVGIFQTQAEVNAWASQNPGKTGPGDLKYKDQNGDNVIDGNDRVVIGSRLPRYTFGSNLSLQFKSFDFSMLFAGVGKVDQYLEGALIQGPTYENFFPTYLLDTWTPENTGAAFPRFALRSSHNTTTTPNSWWVRNGRYVSLRNVNLGYALPMSLVARSGLSTARVYMAGSNLYTWSKLKGLLPPETNPFTSRGNYYFQTRNISIGANISM